MTLREVFFGPQPLDSRGAGEYSRRFHHFMAMAAQQQRVVKEGEAVFVGAEGILDFRGQPFTISPDPDPTRIVRAGVWSARYLSATLRRFQPGK